MIARVDEHHGVLFVNGLQAGPHGVGALAAAVDEGDAVVLIHDAARALTPPAMIARVASIDATRLGSAG